MPTSAHRVDSWRRQAPVRGRGTLILGEPPKVALTGGPDGIPGPPLPVGAHRRRSRPGLGLCVPGRRWAGARGGRVCATTGRRAHQVVVSPCATACQAVAGAGPLNPHQHRYLYAHMVSCTCGQYPMRLDRLRDENDRTRGVPTHDQTVRQGAETRHSPTPAHSGRPRSERQRSDPHRPRGHRHTPPVGNAESRSAIHQEQP